MPYSIMLATFLGAAVEWTEAFTIVLAVSLTIGWPSAASAACAALFALAAFTLAGNAALAFVPLAVAQGIIGTFLVLFGLRWLGKAIARGAGLKPMHDEIAAFQHLRSQTVERRAAWLIAFNGTLLEGLEVWLIVLALGAQGHHAVAAGGAALVALGVVMAVGAMLRAPLARVPENAIKFVVGAALLSFGTFWVLEALGYAWPEGDAALAALVAFYLLGGLALMQRLKVPTRASAI